MDSTHTHWCTARGWHARWHLPLTTDSPITHTFSGCLRVQTGGLSTGDKDASWCVTIEKVLLRNNNLSPVFEIRILRNPALYVFAARMKSENKSQSPKAKTVLICLNEVKTVLWVTHISTTPRLDSIRNDALISTGLKMNNKQYSAQVPAGQQQETIFWVWGLEGKFNWGIFLFLLRHERLYCIWSKTLRHLDILTKKVPSAECGYPQGLSAMTHAVMFE